MTDLPTRLRTRADLHDTLTAGLMRDAADEIERLTPGRVTELEALNAQLRNRVDEFEAREATRRVSVVCPWDAMDDERSDIPETEPCPICGMLGTPDAEDKCLGGPRRSPASSPIVKAEEGA